MDEYGHEHVGGAGRIFEPENVAALHLLLSLIVANGGNAVEIREHGVLGDGLPRLPSGALGALRMNGYITVDRNGAGFRVGLGPHTRAIAARWKISLPDESSTSGGSPG